MFNVQHTHARGPAENIISHFGGAASPPCLVCSVSPLGAYTRTVTNDRNPLPPRRCPLQGKRPTLCHAAPPPSLPPSSSLPPALPQASHARQVATCFPSASKRISSHGHQQRAPACRGGAARWRRGGSLLLPCFGRLVTETRENSILHTR